MAKVRPVKVIPVTCDPHGHLERRALADLTPFQGGLKDLDAARYAKLKASILAEGFMAPVFVWGDKILDGHQRTIVLEREGWDVEGGVPVVEIEADTEADAARKLLKLTSSYGKPQPEGVFDFMVEHDLDLDDFDDVDLPDFDEDALAALFGEDGAGDEPPTDETPEPPVTPVRRTGDLWCMGKHRVLCGDSTADAFHAILALDEIDTILTDPPYCSGGFQEAGRSAGSVGTDAVHKQIANDRLSTRGYQALLRRVFGTWKGQALYCFTDWRMWLYLFDVVEACGNGVRSMIVWDKGSPGMGRGWRSQHEIIMHAASATLPWDKHASGKGNVIQCARTGNKLHTTEKPVDLLVEILTISEWAKVVGDPFTGSGTTLMACHATGKEFRGAEIDPAYVDVSVIRWQEYTNKEAVLDGDGRTFAEVKAERLPGEDVPQAQAAG
jgi:DNA modification methylase